MSLKHISKSDVDERLAALFTNVNAVQAIASAVEGTIGSKGLDTMLVDSLGDVVITNDGITILSRMEVNHPAARMVINAARAQEAEIGDGTTTATIVAGALLTAGLAQAVRGVPVTRIIEGIRHGMAVAISALEERSSRVDSVSDPLLEQVALVAGRGHADIARLVVEAAGMVGADKLREPGFKLADTIIAKESADSAVISGVIVDKEPMNEAMPRAVDGARILVLDDALEPEQLGDDALATESGFARYLQLKQEFRESLERLAELEVNVIIVDRGVDDEAEELLTDQGVMVVKRVSGRQLRQVAEHTGARAIKRTGLRREPAALERYLGRAAAVTADDKLKHVKILGGAGKPMATILVGAATDEVVDERERIACDAAGAVQAAVRGGVVPGGGAPELAVALEVERGRSGVRGMAAYGVDCVVEALQRPLSQIVANAGFNPLEKLGDVLAAAGEDRSGRLGIDCDTGEVADMWELGVIDPLPVKTHALRAAAEIAEAILRIDTIIKKRGSGASGGPDGSELAGGAG